MILKTHEWMSDMRRLFAYFASLFGVRYGVRYGVRRAAAEDHLAGAVDLSDTAYCHGLLSRDSEL